MSSFKICLQHKKLTEGKNRVILHVYHATEDNGNGRGIMLLKADTKEYFPELETLFATAGGIFG